MPSHDGDVSWMYDINSVFSININYLPIILVYQNLFFVKRFFAGRAVALDHLINRAVVIPAHLLIRHAAIAFGGSDIAVAQ